MSAIRVLLMTVPSAETAETIVNTLVAERLIACGNITVPVTSIYRWADNIERAEEVVVIIKTTEDAVTRVTERIAELHPYDVPEVLSLAVESGYGPYLNWVMESVV